MSRLTIFFTILVLLFCSKTFAQKQIANEDLIAYFPFDGHVQDVIGNHKVIETGRVEFIDGPIGQAAVFDGYSFLELEGEDFALEEWSVSFRIFVDYAPPKYWNSVIGKQAINRSVNGKYNWGFFYYPGHWLDSQYETCYSDDDHLLHFGYDLRPGDWYRITGTYGKGWQKMYVNGKLGNSAERNNIPCANSEPLLIGGATTDLAYTFEGKIDELRIYGRALTEEEVLGIENTGQWDGDNQKGIDPKKTTCAYEYIKAFPNVIKQKGNHLGITEIYGYTTKGTYIQVDNEILVYDLSEGYFSYKIGIRTKKGSTYSIKLYDIQDNLLDESIMQIIQNKDFSYVKNKKNKNLILITE